jgi:hypothetical protein
VKIEIRDVQGQRFIEGQPGEPLIESADDVIILIENDYTVHRLLLYPENLPANFFDLSSGEAGAVLQKLRNYHIRLAVVRTPDLQLSSRFGEMLADEMRGPYFRLFDERTDAEAWLCLD